MAALFVLILCSSLVAAERASEQIIAESIRRIPVEINELNEQLKQPEMNPFLHAGLSGRINVLHNQIRFYHHVDAEDGLLESQLALYLVADFMHVLEQEALQIAQIEPKTRAEDDEKLKQEQSVVTRMQHWAGLRNLARSEMP